MTLSTLLRCPACYPSREAALHEDLEQLVCPAGHRFPLLLGIPDLRVPVETWIDFEEDRQLAGELAAHYEHETFEQLTARVWRKRTHVPDAMVARRLKAIYEAESKYEAELSAVGWLGKVVAGAPAGNCIEVGCGTGGFLGPASRRFSGVTGVDVSLAWLITAKKRLSQGKDAADLVCACVERLPFPPDHFDTVVCFDVLGHVDSPEHMLSEIQRITRAAGTVVCTTPNRFSLSAEPHVGLWGVGWLPRKWMARYVRWRNGMIYHHTHPLSLQDIRRLFRELSTTVRTPEIWEGDLNAFSSSKAAVAKAYNWSLRIPLVGRLLLPVAPFFQIIAQRRG